MGGWVGTKITADTKEIAGSRRGRRLRQLCHVGGRGDQGEDGHFLCEHRPGATNLDAELGRFGWDFDAVRSYARKTWNDLLRKIEVEGGTEADRVKFYTNLYRAYVGRTTFSDVNGQYVDPLGKVQQLKNPDSPMYGCDAFWNLFWNLHPLWTLVTPDIAEKWVNSQLELNDRGGWLSKGPAGVRYSGIMVAEHEISLIVSAWQKGIRNFDAEKAYRAIKHIQTTPGLFIYGKRRRIRRQRTPRSI